MKYKREKKFRKHFCNAKQIEEPQKRSKLIRIKMDLYRYYIYNKSIDLRSDLKQFANEINSVIIHHHHHYCHYHHFYFFFINFSSFKIY